MRNISRHDLDFALATSAVPTAGGVNSYGIPTSDIENRHPKRNPSSLTRRLKLNLNPSGFFRCALRYRHVLILHYFQLLRFFGAVQCNPVRAPLVITHHEVGSTNSADNFFSPGIHDGAGQTGFDGHG